MMYIFSWGWKKSNYTVPDHDTVGGLLSLRELDVLDHLSQGSRPDAIADSLGIAKVTVDFHIRNARLKLGARTATEAVAVAIRRRMLD